MENLFSNWEQQPPTCRACYVSRENIDRVGRFFADLGYKTSLEREGLSVVLHLSKDDLLVTVPTDVVVVFGDPPQVMTTGEFEREWRRELREWRRELPGG